MVRKTKEDAEKTREMLLDAAECMFECKGVAATSLQDIARHAGVTRGAVYWHFENKQALFEAMHARVKMPFDAKFEEALTAQDPIAALKALCLFVLESLERDERVRRVFSIILFKCEQVEQNEQMAHRMLQRERAIRKFSIIFTHAQAKGLLHDGVSPELAAMALNSFICGIFTDYLRDPTAYTMDAVASQLVEIMFRGLLKP